MAAHPVFLPGESQGRRSLVGYRIRGVTQSRTRLKRLSSSSNSSLYKTVVYKGREGNGNPLQYSCMANPMDGGAC